MWTIRIKTHNGHGCWWKAILEGDPGRTLVKENATKFGKKQSCINKIKFLEVEYPRRAFEIDDAD